MNKIEDFFSGTLGITLIEVSQFIPTLNKFEDIVIHTFQIVIGILTIKKLLKTNKKDEE